MGREPPQVGVVEASIFQRCCQRHWKIGAEQRNFVMIGSNFGPHAAFRMSCE